MFFRQVLHPDLGCASYVIADGGVAAVVDPKWEIEDYLALADEHGFEIRHVLETHNHADHVSGRGRLAAATGATIHVSPTPGVEYPHETLSDGASVALGDVRIEALATPGHRPEHVAYLVTDRSRGDEPFAVLTGDSLFVGDVARPDLAVEAEDGARDLFHSVRRLRELPDHVQVFPGHIGGSLCGGAGMSEAPGSTIGFERRLNALLGLADEDEFVRRATGGLGAQPPNFRRIVELNRGPLLTEAARLERLEPARVEAVLRDGATLIDGRAPRDWAAGHVPGSVSVTCVRATVGTRAAAAVDPASPVVVTAASEADAARMVRLLEAVGFRDVRGILAGGVEAWRVAGLPLETVESIDPPTLAERLRRREVSLLDVRDPDEWRSGHVEGSLHVPAADLPAQLERIREEVNGLPLAVACAAGNRSAVAVSLLERAGFDRLVHVGEGGVTDLTRYDIDLTKEDTDR